MYSVLGVLEPCKVPLRLQGFLIPGIVPNLL